MKAYKINPITREITPERKDAALGVYFDNNTDGAFFTMQGDIVRELRDYDGRINFVNFSEESVEISIIKDIHIEDDTLTCSWILDRRATNSVGQIIFNLCFIKADGSEWNTTVFKDKILEGLEPSLTPEEEQRFETYYEMLVRQFTEAADAKKQEVLDSIPEDYTALVNEVRENKVQLSNQITEVDSRLSESIENIQGSMLDYKKLSLGVADDNKIYVFYNGIKCGDGIVISGGGVPEGGGDGSELVNVFIADFSGEHPLAEQFYTWTGRSYQHQIFDSLDNIDCEDGVVNLKSTYITQSAKWLSQTMCTAGLFESDDFTMMCKVKFDINNGAWGNIITYGTGTYWTKNLYSDGIKWPVGGEIDAFEQSGGAVNDPFHFQPALHYGSGTESRYPNNHIAVGSDKRGVITGDWQDLMFTLKNGHIAYYLDGVKVAEHDASKMSVSNEHVYDYKPFTKPQAFYLDGHVCNGADTSHVYNLQIKDFVIKQDNNVECQSLTIYPQMWAKGTTITFPIGAEFFMDKVFTPMNTSNKACTWESDNTSVAEVVQGLVKVKGIGNATITARCGSTIATYVVKCASSANVPCAGLDYSGPDEVIISGEEEFYFNGLLLKYPLYTTDAITYTSDNGSVSVSSDGKVIGSGSSVITIACGTKKHEVSVTVKSDSVKLMDYTFDINSTANQKSDTVVGGVIDTRKYTGVFVLDSNPKNNGTATRELNGSFYNNKMPGFSLKTNGEIYGKRGTSSDVYMGTLNGETELRFVFTPKVNGTSYGVVEYYFNGNKVDERTSIHYGGFPVGTDTYFSYTILGDCIGYVKRVALYAGEYLGELD